ncbi:SitI3 family protein [Paractinoplanes rhizophilus]|uniref:SitI3 family protein n=1 Tax=Paractinoplanes rhizophilus TaxID=1416877 RepID=A0ABW2HY88_9ACTN
MAIEYTYYSAADLTTEALRSQVAAVLGGTVTEDGTVVRDGLQTTAYHADPGDEAVAPGLFGFRHRITVRFRFSAVHREFEEHNTALMASVVIGLAGADGVLLFNGEEAVIQVTGGAVIFNAEWDDWAENPETAPLLTQFPSRVLPQPLL